MLEQLLTELHNWFRVRDSVDGKHRDTYTVKGGNIALPFLLHGQYFRIMGSIFNDGLYIYGETIKDGDGNDVELVEETFDGSIWALAVPKVILHLAKERAEIEAKIESLTLEFATNGFTSESFGGYAYSKDVTGQLSALNAQKGQLMNRMNQWRKISED